MGWRISALSENSNMNWERILRAYVDYVQTMEGTTFLTYGNSELDLLELSPD
jgi:hypothetical protein